MACREFRARELELENRLDEELRVPLPDGLADRILGRTANAHRPLRWLALSASLVLATGIGYWVGKLRPDPLALAGIEFVVFDEAQSIVDAKPTEWRALIEVASEMGVSLPERLGDMRYVCLYPLDAGPAHHLFVKTPYGKITLLLLPGRPATSRVAETANGLEAVVVPAGKGSVVIVGASTQSIRRAQALLGFS